MTSLFQLELDQTIVNCGMSYVIQLNDGSFFIVDGGYFTPGEEDRLYSFLDQRSGGAPVIAAWFFTHAHQDHVGNFIQFIDKYRCNVKIKQLIYSFHPVDLSNVDGDWKSSDPATIKEFYRTVDTHCNNIETVPLKSGDRHEFGELTIDVIYTYEDLFPERGSFNDYSTVIKASVGNTRILFLADVGANAARVLLQAPERLACDIVQIAHHGIDNYPVLPDLYAAIPAKVALWPTPDYGMVARAEQDANHFILHDMGIKEHFVSGYGTVRLELPYSLGAAVKTEKRYSLELQPDNADIFPGAQGENSPFRHLTTDTVQPN